MKKIIAMIVAGLMASVAVADIVSFRWAGDGAAASGVTAGDTVFTITDEDATADITAFISGGEIDINDLSGLGLSAYQSSTVVIGPVFAGSKWSTAYTGDISGDDSVAGDFVYAIISDSATLGAIGVNDTFVLTQTAGPLLLQGDPPTTPQDYAPGSVQTITVVPEPATIGLFGLGALSAWIIRRNKQKATEEEA
jgi:hypothetical protein